MNNSEIIDKLLSGEMKLYQVDREVSAKEATDIRREFLEKKYSSSILKEFGIDEPDDYVAQKIFNKSKSPLLDYTYSWYDSDYHSISNPLTGDRDYGLTEYDAYKKWANE